MPDEQAPNEPTFEPSPEDEGSDDATAAGDVIAGSALPQDALAARLEALLFVHSRPVAARRLAELVGLTSVIPVKQALELLQNRYNEHGSAFTLQELAKGYQLTTRPEHDELLAQLVRQREAQKLSPATLEGLAIIAYKQPIGRQEIENIRGAGSDHLVRALLDRALIKVVERDSSKGNAALYGTTAEFLRAFGLRSISELPQEGDLAAPNVDEGDDDDSDAVIEEAEINAPDHDDE
ncbi:MAG: SMC-Scp complex subunit ScpB [Planctomycetota bacterium]